MAVIPCCVARHPCRVHRPETENRTPPRVCTLHALHDKPVFLHPTAGTLRTAAIHIILLVFALSAAKLHGQLDSPDLQCVWVDEDGNVVINWVPPSDPDSAFDTYHLWSSSDGGTTWNETILNNYAATSFVDTGADPSASGICYYMTTEDIDGLMSVASETLCTMFLTVTPSVTPQGYAELSWTSPFLFTAEPSGATYDMLMEFPAGTWNVVGSFGFGPFDYAHEISVCDEFLNFQVALNLPSGCNLLSNIAGDVLTDATAPAIPEVTSVSVDLSTNDVIVSWQPSQSPDTQAYIVYACNGAVVSVIDTVWGYTNTQFVDLLATPLTAPESYLVAAFDTCYSGTPPSPNTSPTGDICNTSILLSSAAYILCEDEVNISWTPYLGWVQGVTSYEVWHSTDNLNFQLAATLPGDQLDYTHTAFGQNTLNYYYVVAQGLSPAQNANSNLVSVATPYPDSPAAIYLASASVTQEDEVTVTTFLAPTVNMCNYHVERRDDAEDDWDEVIVYSYSGTPAFQAIDLYNLNTSAQTYEYRVVVENMCGDFVDTTNIGRTMRLQGIANTSRLVNTLSWTYYGEWENNAAGYRIHRSMDQGLSWTLLNETTGNVNFYEDDVSDMLFTPGDFCYRVEAVEGANTFGVPSSALSNAACVAQVPKVWIPNAFIPGGFNNTWRPTISFADPASYLLVVYDRTGNGIFESTDPAESWDGTYKGEMVQDGSYAYYLAVRDGEGRLYEHTGFVLKLDGD